MTFQSYIGPSGRPFNIVDIPSNASLVELYDRYIMIDYQLGMFADMVPGTDIEAEQQQLQELALLDAQVGLLHLAMKKPISTVEDMKVMINLWDKEVIQGQDISELTAPVSLAKQIFDFAETL